MPQGAHLVLPRRRGQSVHGLRLHPNRKRDGPANWLAGFTGYLQADAYGGYDGIYHAQGVTEVACWAHARRKFYDAQD